MQYRPLGRTGLTVWMLGYGASPLDGVFGQIDEQAAARGVDIAQAALSFSAAPVEFATTFVGSASAENMARNVRWALSDIDSGLLQDIGNVLAPVLNHAWSSGRPENNDHGEAA